MTDWPSIKGGALPFVFDATWMGKSLRWHLISTQRGWETGSVAVRFQCDWEGGNSSPWHFWSFSTQWGGFSLPVAFLFRSAITAIRSLPKVASGLPPLALRLACAVPLRSGPKLRRGASWGAPGACKEQSRLGRSPPPGRERWVGPGSERDVHIVE